MVGEHSGGCPVNGAGTPREAAGVARRGEQVSGAVAGFCVVVLSLIPCSSGAGNQPPLLSACSAPSRTYHPLGGPVQDGLLPVTDQGSWDLRDPARLLWQRGKGSACLGFAENSRENTK